MFTYIFTDNGSIRECGIIVVKIIWFDGEFYNTYSDQILDDDILFLRDMWLNRVRENNWSENWNISLETFERHSAKDFGEIEIDNFLSGGDNELNTDELYALDDEEVVDSLLDSFDDFLDAREQEYKDKLKTNKTLDSVVIPDIKDIVLSYV